jgi:hypothetical protein
VDDLFDACSTTAGARVDHAGSTFLNGLTVTVA